MGVCFVDTETTGLDGRRHEIWEVGLITPDGEDYTWFLPVDESRADLIALNIGRYFERYDPDDVVETGQFAREFQELTRGHNLAGAVVSFDAERLSRLMLRWRVIPAWHYHIIDVEALAAGYIAARYHAARVRPGPHSPPWDSEALSRQVGVYPDEYARHTAIGDARWARAIYQAVIGDT